MQQHGALAQNGPYGAAAAQCGLAHGPLTDSAAKAVRHGPATGESGSEGCLAQSEPLHCSSTDLTRLPALAGLMVKPVHACCSILLFVASAWPVPSISSPETQPAFTRQLTQLAPAELTPQSAPAATGNGVLSLVNNNTGLGPYKCVNSCAQGEWQACCFLLRAR